MISPLICTEQFSDGITGAMHYPNDPTINKPVQQSLNRICPAVASAWKRKNGAGSAKLPKRCKN
jgi:hypothetical protein